jgi:DNA polymerase III subunit gamma/tau
MTIIRVEKDGRPHRRAACEPGQSLTAAAISGVVRALGYRPSFSSQSSWSPKLSYTVLARRYRSKTFDDVIGQEPIAKTLRNAILSDRTAHAYLFCGTRGVGKTSMARIFARELNTSAELQESDAIAEAVLRGEDLDVIEIDGASNRGVQEARDLIAAAGLAPARCAYRIYIIDEVHMLTTPAFNALLKTMEEPPSHVKFILCTTEPHKIPATIQSRCQRFDFRTIPSVKIAQHLTNILNKEGIQADKEVIANVSRLGNGSMRDALSILDRLLAGGQKIIATEEMEMILGLPSQTAITSICMNIVQSNVSGALEGASNLLGGGVAMDRALEELASCFRHALIARVCGEESSLLELSDTARSEASSMGVMIDVSSLTHMIALCDAASRQVRRGGSGRALFDATIARLCLSKELAEAGIALTQVDSSPSVQIKKKSNSPTVAKTLLPQQVTPTVTIPSKFEWSHIQSVLSQTPGLKRITSYLLFKSFADGILTLSINSEGQESSTYILGKRGEIEQVCSDIAERRCTVKIEGEEGPEVTHASSINPEVAASEIVKTASDLFDGTLLRVQDFEGEKDSKTPERGTE